MNERRAMNQLKNDIIIQLMTFFNNNRSLDKNILNNNIDADIGFNYLK